MDDNYLLIVEGSKTEPNIFSSVLTKYGFNVIVSNKKIDTGYGIELDYSNFKNNQKNVFIIEGPRNRIHDFLVLYNKNDSLERALKFANNSFKGIFLIYDVDHNDEKDIKEMYEKFKDESSGLLLLSSPCIEVLGEYNHDRVVECNRVTEYKSDLNQHYCQKYGSVEKYIINNFEKLCFYYLNKNYEDFKEQNVMEHPKLIIDLINKYNTRVNYSKDSKQKSYVIYRYLTTVVYVFIAYINGLTTKLDNFDDVKSFFESR